MSYREVGGCTGPQVDTHLIWNNQKILLLQSAYDTVLSGKQSTYKYHFSFIDILKVLGKPIYLIKKYSFGLDRKIFQLKKARFHD
jgi:hypothetical protein